MTLVKVTNPISNPFNGLMNEIFNDLPASYGKALKTSTHESVKVNILENKNSYQIQVLVPGFEKNDFSVKVDGNLLTIESLKKETTVDENVKQIRSEFNIKSFKRSFTVDEKIDSSNISASYANGILNVILPKKEIATVAVKEIVIN